MRHAIQSRGSGGYNRAAAGGQPLLQSLADAGYSSGDITDVVLTHLHWDHVNGAIQSKGKNMELTFPNATHWSSRRQWEHAHVSNQREKVTYFTDFFSFLEQSGKLRLVDNEGELFPGFTVRFFDGHTPGQMIPFIEYNGKTMVYTADLVPTAAHIPVLWIAAYDLYPVTVMEEKERFIQEVAKKGFILFFEHDNYTECATVHWNGKRSSVKEKFTLDAICT